MVPEADWYRAGRMPDLDDFPALADQHLLGDPPVPTVVSDSAAGHPFVLEGRHVATPRQVATGDSAQFA